MRFILIDQILELRPGQLIRTTKTIPPGEELFQDHFPGFPVVPGVLLTEMMAQAAGKCLDTENPERGRAMLARIENASFRDWVRPGEIITAKAEIRSSRPSFAVADCQACVNEKVVCSAKLFFTFVPLARFTPCRDLVLEEYRSRTATS